MLRVILFLWIAFLTFNLHANDTAFGGSGAAPIPIKQNNIRMLSDRIFILGDEIARTDMRGSWHYKCDYKFKNETDASITLRMGFPIPVNDELSETTVPEGYASKKGGALVYNFQVTANNKLLPIRKTKIQALPNLDLPYTDAYIWNLTIPGNEVVDVHHDYISGVTINSMGQNYVAFVLKTGKLWKDGTIDSLHIEVVPNTPTRLCSEIIKDADYLAPKPAGMKIIEGKQRKYVWDLTNYVPQEDLELCLISGRNYVRYYIENPLMQDNGSDQLKKMSAKELRTLRNTIYARHGKKFQDPDLQNYFEHQWWYEPNPNYSDIFLSIEDKNLINLIQQREQRVQ